MTFKEFLYEEKISESKFRKIIKEYDSENLAYWTDKELNEMGVNYKIIEKLDKEGILKYVPKDDIFCAKNTYFKLYKDVFFL